MATVTDQPMRALALANEMRTARRLLKVSIARWPWREVLPVVLADPPVAAVGMRVPELLRAGRRVGEVRVTRWLRAVGVSPYRRVGSLTERERAALIVEVTR